MTLEEIVIQYLEGVDEVRDAQKHRELAPKEFHSTIADIINSDERDIHYNDLNDNEDEYKRDVPNHFNTIIL